MAAAPGRACGIEIEWHWNHPRSSLRMFPPSQNSNIFCPMLELLRKEPTEVESPFYINAVLTKYALENCGRSEDIRSVLAV